MYLAEICVDISVDIVDDDSPPGQLLDAAPQLGRQLGHRGRLAALADLLQELEAEPGPQQRGEQLLGLRVRERAPLQREDIGEDAAWREAAPRLVAAPAPQLVSLRHEAGPSLRVQEDISLARRRPQHRGQQRSQEVAVTQH